MVNLEDCITVHMTLYHKKHKHVFGIETRSRLYFLVASSEDEMKEWVVAITTVCGLVLAEGMCVCVCVCGGREVRIKVARWEELVVRGMRPSVYLKNDVERE